jgi:hypothetical protein
LAHRSTSVVPPHILTLTASKYRRFQKGSLIEMQNATLFSKDSVVNTLLNL